MNPDEIIKKLSEDFPTLAFFYLKREHKTRNLFEFFFSGYYNGSVIFDFNILPEEEKYNLIKKSVLDFNKRIEEKQCEDENEEESKIKKLWKK